MLRRFAVLLCVLAAPVLVGVPATAATRVALVVGNGNYEAVAPLPNPLSDAEGVAAALERLGFAVTLATDLDKAGFDRAIREFSKALKGAEVALFFYAGHGMQVSGTNYLMPVDAQVTVEADLYFEAIDLNLVIGLMEQGVPTALVFLDACRDNPMAQTLAQSLGKRSSAVGRGLAQVDSGIGTLIAYATQPGNVALDGKGQHSPFTAALLEHIETPAMEIRQVLSRVRESVVQATDRQQVPWDHSSLIGDFYFLAAAEQVASVPPSPAPAPGAPAEDRQAEIVFWQTIQDSTDWRDFEAYIKRFGTAGVYYDLALSRMDRLKAAEEAASSTAAEEERQRQEQAAQAAAEATALARIGELPPAAIQYALKALGHYSGRVDGKLGSGSKAAIRAFQQGKGWANTGELTAEQTVALVQDAAAKGQAASQVILGFMYAEGIGLVQDYAGARIWFGKAAAQGDAYGLFNLAVLHRDGLGGPADPAEAKRLFAQAEKAGHPEAKAALQALGG